MSIIETHTTPLPDVFTKAASEIGLDEIDVNGKDILGKIVHKRQRKAKGQSRLDNPETRVTFTMYFLPVSNNEAIFYWTTPNLPKNHESYHKKLNRVPLAMGWIRTQYFSGDMH